MQEESPTPRARRNPATSSRTRRPDWASTKPRWQPDCTAWRRGVVARSQSCKHCMAPLAGISFISKGVRGWTAVQGVVPMTASNLLRIGIVAACGVALGAQEKAPSADAVLRELKAGNDHHVAKRYQHPHQTAARQRELADGQHPHAIVLSCADSRVAPEIILDQGLGDLFDVRVAGNVASDIELASIEYAA